MDRSGPIVVVATDLLERRSEERVGMGVPFALQSAWGCGVGICRNYARGGILFYSDRRLKLGRRVRVELPLGGPDSAKLWLEVLLLRVRCDPRNPVLPFESAAAILSPLPEPIHHALIELHRRAA